MDNNKNPYSDEQDTVFISYSHGDDQTVPEYERTAPYSGDLGYIFVSYSHKDSETVLSLIARLQREGYRVWYDEGIDPGTEWDDNIAKHVLGCDSFIAFISPNYIDSDNCKDEINFARDLNKDRLIVYLEKTTLPPGLAMRLNRLQAIHKYTYKSEEDFYKKLFQTPILAKSKSAVSAGSSTDNSNYGSAESYQHSGSSRTAEKIDITKIDGLQHLTDIAITGRGGLGTVYKATNPRNGKIVAVKLYNITAAFHCPVFSRYDLSNDLMKIQSQNVCSLYHVERGSHPYTIMEYIDGDMLSTILRDNEIELYDALLITKHILTGLNALHMHGIYYGDLTPYNVMIDHNGAHLCDFSASNYNGTKIDEETIMFWKFRSPERLRYSIIDYRSDIYEAGAILDEMTLMSLECSDTSLNWHQLSFDPAMAKNMNIDHASALYNIIKKAAENDVSKRYQSADEMIADIDEVLQLL